MFRYRLRAYFTRRAGLMVVCWLAALAALGLLGLSAANRFLADILDSYIEVRLEALFSQAVNSTVLAQIEADPALYQGLVTLWRNQDGAVTAVDTDTARVNLIKAQVAQGTLAALELAENQNLTVPVGTLLGGSLLLGRGPAVSIRVMPAGAANTTVVSAFTAAGINQTLHRVALEVEVAMTVIRPGAAVTSVRSQQLLLSETVIAGRVPESFTYIDDTRTDSLEKIFDHGLGP